MRLAPVTLDASSIPAAQAFYQNLGLRLIVDSPHNCRFQVGEAATTLSIPPSAGPIAPSGAVGIVFDGAAILDACVAKLQANGLADSAPEDQS